MTKGTRRLGRVAAIAVPMLAALVAASCSSGGTDSGGTTTTGSDGTSAGGNNSGGAAPTSTSTSSGTSTGNGGNGGAGGVANPKCVTDAECAKNDANKVCDVATGSCVACTPTSDVCPQGQYCDPTTNACKGGCTDDTDCAVPGSPDVHCDTTKNTCVGCLADTDCQLGFVCFAATQTCIQGCSDTQACQAGYTCCSGTCFDIVNDVNHCGDCGTKCAVPAHAAVTCSGKVCGMGMCDPAYADCDGKSATGCEQNVLQDGACTCVPGTTQACYQGSPGTQNVGPCKGGTQTCNPDGISWSACGGGQVLPKAEICSNSIDDDCDGTVDNVVDADGDGWTSCNGDCNDTNALVNPGAFEVVGNAIDDDCDPLSSDVAQPAACSTAVKFTGVTASDVAKAMDLCQTTTANAPLAIKKWGLIASNQYLANGTVPSAADLTTMQNLQTAVLQNFGNVIVPHKGSTFAGVSTGAMRDANDAGYVPAVSGSTYASAIPFSPAPGAPLGTYIAQHNNNLLPGTCGATTCQLLSTALESANDSVDVQLKIRVPTNAKSFSYDFRFFSREYQTFQCTNYNDYYLAMLTSAAPGIPADHNISFDTKGNAVSVNNGFFDVCGGNGKSCGGCTAGTAELSGTGLDVVAGGGTTWLVTQAPVVPGETLTLDLVIFDVGDHAYDSLVLLDNFQWSLNASSVVTHM
jgi:Putative metal-binding motif